LLSLTEKFKKTYIAIIARHQPCIMFIGIVRGCHLSSTLQEAVTMIRLRLSSRHTIIGSSRFCPRCEVPM